MSGRLLSSVPNRCTCCSPVTCPFCLVTSPLLQLEFGPAKYPSIVFLLLFDSVCLYSRTIFTNAKIIMIYWQFLHISHRFSLSSDQPPVGTSSRRVFFISPLIFCYRFSLVDASLHRFIKRRSLKCPFDDLIQSQSDLLHICHSFRFVS